MRGVRPPAYSWKTPLDNDAHAQYHSATIGRTDMSQRRIPRATPMHAPHILPPPPPPPLLIPTTA